MQGQELTLTRALDMVQKDAPRITEQAHAALEAMGKKAHGGNDDGK